MNRKEKSQLNRELRGMPVPPPPPGLLDSIKSEIPLELPALADRQEEERLVRFYDRPAAWWMAASIAMIFTFVFIGSRIYLESQVEQQASLGAEPFAANKAVQQRMRDVVSSETGGRAEPAGTIAPQPGPSAVVAESSRQEQASPYALESQTASSSPLIGQAQADEAEGSAAIPEAASEMTSFAPEVQIAEAITVTSTRSEPVADAGVAASRSAAPAAPAVSAPPVALSQPVPPPAAPAGRRSPLAPGHASPERAAAAVAFEADIASRASIQILIVDHPRHADRLLVSLATASAETLTVSSDSSAAWPMRVIHASPHSVRDGRGSVTFHPGRHEASILLEVELRTDAGVSQPFLTVQADGTRQLLRADQARGTWKDLPPEQRLAFLEELVRQRIAPEEMARTRADLVSLRNSLPRDHPLQERIGRALAQLER
jgi:hypothetical protein